MKILTSLSTVLAVMLTAGCGPTYVRGSENPELDDYAMSTGLDKRDLEQLFDENMNALLASPLAAKWKEADELPIVALFPIANETSEHVRDQLDTLLSKMETDLFSKQVARIVARERQDELIAEVKRQQGGAFDETQAASVGKQLGAKYILTGKVYDSAEKTGGERRVQYFLFMRILSLETSLVEWQYEANLTKGLVK